MHQQEPQQFPKLWGRRKILKHCPDSWLLQGSFESTFPVQPLTCRGTWLCEGTWPAWPLSYSRFLSNPFMIRVPFFLIFSFNKGTLNQKGQKGTTQEPRFPWHLAPL